MRSHRFDKIVLLGIMALVVIPSTGTADEARADGAVRLDLPESIARSRELHPDLGPKRAGVLEARADLSKAEAGRYPAGELTSIFGAAPGAEFGDPPEGLPEELAPLFSEDKNTELLDDLNFFTRNMVRVTVPIYTFGKITSGIDAATAGLDAMESNLERAEEDAVLELKRIYYGHQLTTVLTDLLGEISTNFDEAVDQAQARLEEGAPGIGQSDVLKLKLARGRTKAQSLRLRQQGEVALAAYRRALGLPPGAPVWPAQERLTAVKVVPLEAVEELEREIVGLPEWRAVEKGHEAKIHAAEVEWGKLYPDLFLNGIFNYAWAPGRDDVTNPFLWDPFNEIQGGIFLGVRYDLDFFGNTARAQRADAEALRLAAERERARIGLPLAVRRAHLKYEERRDTLDLARQDRKSGRALAFLAMSNFRIGIGDGREILESLGLYTKAATDYHRAVHGFNVAVAELSRAIGRELAVELIVAGEAPRD